MKNIEFKYTDLKDGRVLIEVSNYNKDYFKVGFYQNKKYNNKDYYVYNPLDVSQGEISLTMNEGKIIKVIVSLGKEQTIGIIDRRYVYIFAELENKVFGIKEKKLFDVLNIKKEDLYYYICYDNFYKNFFIRNDYNYNKIDDTNSEMVGNVFKTVEDAEDFIKKLEKLFTERKQKLLELG